MDLLAEFILDRPKYQEYLKDEKIMKQNIECSKIHADLLRLIEKVNLEKMTLEDVLKKNKIEFMDFVKIYNDIYHTRKKLLRVLENLDILMNKKDGIIGSGWERYSDEIRDTYNDYPLSFFEKCLIL